MLTHITLINTVWVYRVTSDNFFPPKLISKNLILFLLYSSRQDLSNKKRIIRFGSEIRKLWGVKANAMQ